MNEKKDLTLFKISQKVKNGYDTYDAAIVSAHDEEDARMMNPGCLYDEFPLGDTRAWVRYNEREEGYVQEMYVNGQWVVLDEEQFEDVNGSWCESPEDVIVERLGPSEVDHGFVLKSFNAG